MPLNKNGKMTKTTYIYIVLQFYLREGMNVLMSVLINVSIKRAMGG